MIQIYTPSNTDYSKNGDQTLFPISAPVHAILNGAWEAEITHPIDADGRWKYITEEAVIKMPSFNGDQLFRVKTAQKQDSGVTATLEPIFYDSMGDCWLSDVRPTGKNGQDALDIMLAPNSKYSGLSNITRAATAYYQNMNFMQALNGDIDQSFINRWGGEILFDNFTVIVNDRVGGDYGIELRYGKNIPQDGMSYEVDTRDVVTRIYPQAYNGYKMTGNGYVDSPLINNYPTVKAVSMSFENVKMRDDAQEDDEENGVIICDTHEELDAALTQQCETQYDAGIDKPTVTISADMVLLQNTEQYKDIKTLEAVSLGDTIHCINTHLDITTDARVIEIEFDAVRKKVSSVVIGDFRQQYFDGLTDSAQKIDSVINPDGSLMAEKVQGILNGIYTQLRLQSTVSKKVDGVAFKVEELDEDAPLFGCMVWGTQGIQISTTRTADGKDWDWTTAITAKGIVANAIITGILSDKTGDNYWNLDTGEFRLTSSAFKLDGEDVGDYVYSTLDQQKIFDKLTNKGAAQGIYLTNGQLYISFSYARGGILRLGDQNNGDGEMEVYDSAGNLIGKWDMDGFSTIGDYFSVDENGETFSTRFYCSKLRMAPTIGDTMHIDTIKSTYSTVISVGASAGSTGVTGNSLDIGEGRSGDPENIVSMTLGSKKVVNRFEIVSGRYIDIYGDARFHNDLIVSGEKNRTVNTPNFGDRLLHSYETTSPTFGDVGTAKIDSSGECVIYIDDILYETINTDIEYQVFLQAEGEGGLFVKEKKRTYFTVKGEPGLKFAWEIKAKQRDYEYNRLEMDVKVANVISADHYLPTSIKFEELEDILYEAN